MSDQNATVVLRLFDEVLHKGKLELVDELVHPDFFNHDAVVANANGPVGFRRTATALRTAFAGLRLDPDDVIVSDDKVVIRCRASGRHVGEFHGMQPTGREFSVQHIHIFRLADGKVIEHWACRDDLGARIQIGLLPPLSPAAEPTALAAT
jgi:predicted ester cyclase